MPSSDECKSRIKVCVFHELSLGRVWLLTYAEGPGSYVLTNL